MGNLQITACNLQIEIIPHPIIEPQIAKTVPSPNKKAAKAYSVLSQLCVLRKIDFQTILISPHNIVILKILAYQYITILLRVDGYDSFSILDKINLSMMHINLIKADSIPIDKLLFIIIIQNDMPVFIVTQNSQIFHLFFHTLKTYPPHPH